MNILIRWWEKPKPLAWVAWADYCGAAGLYALWLIYDRGPQSWQGSVADAVTWPAHLARLGWAAIGGAA